HRTGASSAMFPPTTAKRRLDGLELQARRHPRPLDALGRNLAVAEEPLAERDTAHLQALELQRRQPVADDEFGTAAADIGHEAAAGLAGHGMRDPRINQAGFFHARDDLDRVPERLAGALEKRLLAMSYAQRIGADDAHAVGVHVTKSLTETLQACQSAGR